MYQRKPYVVYNGVNMSWKYHFNRWNVLFFTTRDLWEKLEWVMWVMNCVNRFYDKRMSLSFFLKNMSSSKGRTRSWEITFCKEFFYRGINKVHNWFLPFFSHKQMLKNGILFPKLCCSKVELSLEGIFFRTQFSSLGIFINKNVRKTT